MDLGLRGRVAVVCAASSGLGKAAAAGFLREGAHVVICSRSKTRLRAAAKELSAIDSSTRVLPVVADLTRARDVKMLVGEAVKTFGRVDILVTNSGGPPVATFPQLDDARWEDGITLNLMSTIRCIREVLPHMRKRKWGRIVNITSITAKQPAADLVVSSTVRPGILGLAKVLAAQYGRDGILINSVAPGYIDTDRQKEISESRAAEKHVTREQYMHDLAQEVPLKRYGEAEELANVIVFLASERASFVTGATISVDGGLSKGLL